jgi:uncharacterized hydrophobic protein (TIGR00271 family)
MQLTGLVLLGGPRNRGYGLVMIDAGRARDRRAVDRCHMIAVSRDRGRTDRSRVALLSMSMLHVRVVSPADLSDGVEEILRRQSGAANLIVLPGVAREPAGDLYQVDLVRECVQEVVSDLRLLGIDQRGSISWRRVDTAIGAGMQQAERDAPGEGADAIIWDEIIASTGEDSTLTWTFMAFMILACILAAIGIATNSPITVVGAMVVGPEFGPLAGIAVGLRLRRGDSVRRGIVALVVGFAGAIAAAAAVAALWRATGLVHARDLATSTQTEFIYHPGWFSVITALVAGAAGMLALTSAKSSALVGVFISVTTIPAAGNAALALVFGHFHVAAESALQLLINLTGIVVAAYLVLLLRGHSRVTGDLPPARKPARW